MQYPVLAAFVVGLFSTLHCVGMCGGIMGALTYSLPQAVRDDRPRLLAYLSAYNLGRIGSYVLAGGLLGTLGSSLLDLMGDTGHRAVQLLAALLLTGIGLYIAGWFPKFALIEHIGIPLWRRLEPVGRRLLPVDALGKAFTFGAIWGWLPCGMVYSMLLWSVSAADTAGAMAIMAGFGLGTLPAVMGAGMLTAWLGRMARLPWVRQIAGLALVGMALGGFFLTDWLPAGPAR